MSTIVIVTNRTVDFNLRDINRASGTAIVDTFPRVPTWLVSLLFLITKGFIL